MSRVVRGVAKGILAAGNGAFTRVLRTNKNAQKLIMNKVRGGRQPILAVHSQLSRLHAGNKPAPGP